MKKCREILPLAITTVRGAIRTKSKPITKHILLTINIQESKDDIVFVIIPKLNRECILGIEMLKLYDCVLDFKNNQIILNVNNIKDGRRHE